MIKTYILFCLLILISGCSLALTKPDDNENENNNFDNEEKLVGMWVKLWDDKSTFESATTLKLYEKTNYINNHPVSEIVVLPGFCNIKINKNNIEEDGKKLSSTIYEADIIFNRNYYKPIRLFGIYEKNNEIYETPITSVQGLGAKMTFNTKATVNENSEESTVERTVIVNVEAVDTLNYLTIEKFDKDSNLIDSETITSDEEKTLNINNEVEYIIISEYFTDKNGDYVKRTLINQNEFDKPFLLKFTNEKGYVNGNMLIFKKVDSL